MQEVLNEDYKKFEEKSWDSYQAEDYESALYYAQHWKHLAEKKYGHESAEVARCLRRLGQILYSMKLPEKEFEAEYGRDDSVMPFCDYLLILASPFYWLQQNLQQPMDLFQEGYDMLKKTKGSNAPETIQHKRLFVEFICEKTLAAHFTQSLWMLITIIPLLFILMPMMAGLSWQSLGVALLITGLLVVWRIIGAVFFFFLTKHHYDRAIQ